MNCCSRSFGRFGRAKSRLLPIRPFLLGLAFACLSTIAAANNQATGDFIDPGNDWAPSPNDGNTSIDTAFAPDKNQPINSIPIDPSQLSNSQFLAHASTPAEGFPIPANTVWGDLAAGQNLEGPDGPAIGLHSGSSQLVLVTVSPPFGVAAEQEMEAAKQRKPEVEALVSSQGGTIINSYSELPVFLADLNSDLLATLAASGKVAGLETIDEYELHLESTIPIVKAYFMHRSGTDGSGYEGDATPWVVAVLDNGTRVTHNAFAGRVLAEACYVNAPYECPNGATSMVGSGAACGTSSDCLHGTHTAGIAVGEFIGWLGLTRPGVASGAQLVAVDIFSGGTTSSNNIIDGLNYVLSLANAGERIAAVNMSLGGGAFTGYCDSSYPATLAAVAALDNLGVAVVASAGNDSSTTTMGYPACLSNSIAVGNTEDNDVVASSSSTSPMMDVWAPGSNVDSAGANSDSHILYGLTGTSMSAAHVSGTIALLRECTSMLHPPGSAGANELALTGLQAGPLVSDTRVGGSVTAPRINVVDAGQTIWSHNDDIANALAISGTAGVLINNACATGESGEPNHYAGSGSGGDINNSVWFNWTAPSTGVYTFSTCSPETTFDTMLALYSGTDYSNLIQLAADDDNADCAFNSKFSTVSAPVYTGDSLKIAMRGFGFETGNGRIDITQISTFIPTCNGQAATQTGFSTDDNIYGTESDDVIITGGGADSVYGLGGNDVLCLGGGNDYAYGGRGSDIIIGGGHVDTIHGSYGNDLLVGNNDDDYIYGDDGNDIIYGSAGNDVLDGGAGDDRVYGNNGEDTMRGSGGRDIMRGYAGDDYMEGGYGIDNMSGGSGDDIMRGGHANDTMFGNTGSDQLYGENQNDYLNGGNDPGDVCDGGDGSGDSATGSCETIANVP